MSFVKKGNVERDMNEKNVAVISGLLRDSSERDMKIETLLREQYSLSQELAIHRKKMSGEIEEEEWENYVSYVKECIAKAKEETHPSQQN